MRYFAYRTLFIHLNINYKLMSEKVKNQVHVIMDGFFGFFGFIELPVTGEARKVVEGTPAEKIRADLRKVNSDYRRTFLEVKKEVLSIER